MEVRDRVHIVAQGWEVERILAPVYRLKADTVVFIRRPGDDALSEFERDLLDDLAASERIALEVRTADLYDLDSTLQAFTQAVQDHADEDVFINLASGTQLAAIAGMVAAQASDAIPFYVRPTDGEAVGIETPTEPLVPAAGAITELPVFRLEGPSPEQLQILAHLAGNEGVTKKDLIRFAEDRELPFIANTEATSDEGRYRLLETHIIDPLTQGGYVRVERAGRQREVHLERRGLDALAAFPLDREAMETVTADMDQTYGNADGRGGVGSIDAITGKRWGEKRAEIFGLDSPWQGPPAYRPGVPEQVADEDAEASTGDTEPVAADDDRATGFSSRLEVTDRVHIAALGWEVARIMDPLLDLKADKLVLICPLDDALLADFEHEMLADLEAMDRIDLEVRPANLYDLDSALQAFTQAVRDHEGDDVFINVSTGTRIAGIAGMMAAQTSEATPFFVEPRFEGDDGDSAGPAEPITDVAGDIDELPVFELQGPSPEQLQILAFLVGTDGVTKKALIRFAEDRNLPFIATTEATSDEGRYRLLESHIIEPLTEGGYVRVERAGRQRQVHIEQRGLDALATFPLEPEVLDTLERDGESGDTLSTQPHDGRWKSASGTSVSDRHSANRSE